MKKSDLIYGILCTAVGVVFLLLTLLTETKADGLFLSAAVYCLIFGIGTLRRYAYWNSPENRERGQEIAENERIESQDELKIKIRDKAGRYAYTLGLFVAAGTAILFGTLGELEILENPEPLVLYLTFYLILQLAAERIIYNHLMKKY